MTFITIYYLFLLLVITLYLIITNGDTYRLLENIYKHKGYVFVYVLLVFLSILYFDYNELIIKNEFLYKFGLTNRINHTNFYTLITNNLIHSDVLHLFVNLLFLTFLATLEYHYGYILFLLMFFIPSIISSLIFVLFLPNNIVSLGASNSLCSLYSLVIAENLIIDKLPVDIVRIPVQTCQ